MIRRPPRSALFPSTTLFRSDPFRRATRASQYATRHNPFVYFRSITDDRESCRERVVGLRELATEDRKSTRLNSSHANISYAVFCLKKKIGRQNTSPARLYY